LRGTFAARLIAATGYGEFSDTANARIGVQICADSDIVAAMSECGLLIA
jgi:hypothetical protein